MFLDACGAAAPLELEVTGPQSLHPTRTRLEAPFAIVGRHRRCMPALHHPEIARRHLYIQLIAGWPFAINLSPGADTELGHWLSPGESIRVGPYSVRLPVHQTADSQKTPVEEWNPLESGTADRLFLPTATLEFLGRRPVTRWQINRVLSLVGRQPPCKVVLEDRSISRFHCALLLTPLGLWVINLLGRDGTWVNGRPVRWALVEDGAHVRVGRFPIRIWYQQTVRPEASGSFLQALSLGEQPLAPLPLPPAPVNGHAGPPAPPEAPLPVPSLPAELAGPFERMQQQMLSQFQQGMVMMAQMLASMHQDQMDLLNEAVERLHSLKRQVRTLQVELKKHASLSGHPSTNGAAEAEEPAETEPIDAEPKTPQQPAAPQAPEASSPAASPDAAIPAGEFHLWFHERMQALQKERQSLLQKILSAVTGK